MCYNMCMSSSVLRNMKFSDAKQRKVAVRKNRDPLAPTNKRWSDKQKLETVQTYFMLGGNLSLVGKTLNIPYQTLMSWKSSDWWHDLENEFRREEKIQLSTKLKKIADSGLSVIADRMEKGDWVINQKTGELVRRPVLMKDAAKVAMDASTLRTKLDLNDNHTVSAEHVEDKLAKLAKAFSDLAKGITNQEIAETIEYTEKTDALHEGREA